MSGTIVAHDTTNRVCVLWFGFGDVGRVVDSLLIELRAVAAIARAEQVFCAFDSPGRTFRHDLDSGYKSHRASKPRDEGLAAAIRQAYAATEAAGHHVCDVRGFEADDILATLAKRATDDGRRVVIVTPDKDARQCLQAGAVSILQKYRRERDKLADAVWLTADKFVELHGFQPERWIDFQAIVGDPTDDIIGWRGVGEKTAGQWLREHTLDEILAEPGRVKMTPTQLENLADFAARLPIVRQLVTLRKDVPL